MICQECFQIQTKIAIGMSDKSLDIINLDNNQIMIIDNRQKLNGRCNNVDNNMDTIISKDEKDII